MRRLAALALAAALGACAFWSEAALFADGEAAHPIADGARYTWIEDGVLEETMVYRRAGAGYEVAAIGDDDPPPRVLFFAVSETPEADYIVQVAIRSDEPGRFYAFMWRTAGGYRMVTAPRVLEGDDPGRAALARRCSARPNGECRLDRVEDLLGLYRETIYPAFVVAARTPNDYIDQLETTQGPKEK